MIGEIAVGGAATGATRSIPVGDRIEKAAPKRSFAAVKYTYI
jgi:hypothetical protein